MAAPTGGMPPGRTCPRSRSAYCGGYLNGAQPVLWIGAGMYVADDAFDAELAGVVTPAAGLFATGFFATAFLAVAFLVIFFMRRTLQQPAKGRQYTRMRNRRMRTLVGLALVLLAAGPLHAQTLEPAAQEALAATLRMLRDPALRAPAVAGNPQASAIDKQVLSMTGSPQLAQEFYDLAALIFEDLTRHSGGDADRMRETLESAAKDPAAFASLLRPATLDRLRALAVKISDRPR